MKRLFSILIICIFLFSACNIQTTGKAGSQEVSESAADSYIAYGDEHEGYANDPDEINPNMGEDSYHRSAIANYEVAMHILEQLINVLKAEEGLSIGEETRLRTKIRELSIKITEIQMLRIQRGFVEVTPEPEEQLENPNQPNGEAWPLVDPCDSGGKMCQHSCLDNQEKIGWCYFTGITDGEGNKIKGVCCKETEQPVTIPTPGLESPTTKPPVTYPAEEGQSGCSVCAPPGRIIPDTSDPEGRPYTELTPPLTCIYKEGSKWGNPGERGVCYD